MTWPSGAVVTTNLDAGSDSPATARADLLDATQKLNQIIAHVSAYIQGLFDDANAAAARATLGSTTVGDAVFIAANAAAARTAIDAFANTGGTLTGDAAISKATPILTINESSGSGQGIVRFQDNAVNRWQLIKNSDDQFWIYNDGRATADLAISNSTGNVTFGASVIADGNSFIGDTANVNATLGLTINQGAADNEILALKSSDVAHGMTDITETDSFGTFAKAQITSGGARLVGFTSAVMGVHIAAHYTTDDTTKSTSALGATIITGAKKSGTTVDVMGSDANILTVRNGTLARFILDAEGDSHQDVGTAWTNFDAHRDVDLLTALSVHVSGEADPIRCNFASFLDFNRQRLQDLKLVTFNDDGHHFVNMSKLTMLLTGAVRQMATRMDAIEEKLKLLTI